jgi:hypothetical protein
MEYPARAPLLCFQSQHVATSYCVHSAQVLSILAFQLSECYVIVTGEGILIGNWTYWTLERVTAKNYDVIRMSSSVGNRACSNVTSQCGTVATAVVVQVFTRCMLSITGDVIRTSSSVGDSL